MITPIFGRMPQRTFIRAASSTGFGEMKISGQLDTNSSHLIGGAVQEIEGGLSVKKR